MDQNRLISELCMNPIDSDTMFRIEVVLGHYHKWNDNLEEVLEDSTYERIAKTWLYAYYV